MGLLIFWAPTSLLYQYLVNMTPPGIHRIFIKALIKGTSHVRGGQKPELQATRTLLRVYDEAQRLFQHVDVPMAWGPMVVVWVGCNMSVILGAAIFVVGMLRPHCHCSFSRSGWDAMGAFVTKTWIKVGGRSVAQLLLGEFCYPPKKSNWLNQHISEFFISLKGW